MSLGEARVEAAAAVPSKPVLIAGTLFLDAHQPTQKQCSLRLHANQFLHFPGAACRLRWKKSAAELALMRRSASIAAHSLADCIRGCGGGGYSSGSSAVVRMGSVCVGVRTWLDVVEGQRGA